MLAEKLEAGYTFYIFYVALETSRVLWDQLRVPKDRSDGVRVINPPGTSRMKGSALNRSKQLHAPGSYFVGGVIPSTLW